MTAVSAFDYPLPPDAIAQQPVEPRDAARILVDRAGHVTHRHASDLPELLEPGDLLVVNDTRVLPARLALLRDSGGAVEVLLLEPRAERRWEALARPTRRLREGERLANPGGLQLGLVEHLGEGRWIVELGGEEPIDELLARHGEVPLPPYVTDDIADPERYQTVYAASPTSVAAPTAGLHLTTEVLDRCRSRGIDVVACELSVGIGTFRPMITETVADHRMHTERYRIPPATAQAIEAAPRVVAVGTTVVRTLESWAATGVLEGRTDLFIHGEYRFAVVDRLLTNFHVPRSSLLVLIDAFVGPRWRELYAEAIAEGYRFLSFGDAMLVDRR